MLNPVLTRIWLALAMLLLPLGCSSGTSSNPPPASTDGARWYKGNLHTHSLWSDGDDFPERIAAWYRDQAYQFLAISDHNTAQTGEKWVKFSDLKLKGAAPAAEQYLKDFKRAARTRGQRNSTTFEIRLRPFAEYAPELSRAGRFLLIQSEEISAAFDKRSVHINATNLAETIKPATGPSTREVIANNLRLVKEQAERLNRPILPHLNHPNFQWGVRAEDLAHVLEEQFFEVYNGHPDVRQTGDKDHPSVERIWDIANTIRLAELKAPPLMGLATDDTHHYHTSGISRATAGRGWIHVRSTALTPEALISSMEAGDFYASSGVKLHDVRFDKSTQTLHLHINTANDEGASYTTQFIGTRVGSPNPDAIGITFATAHGPTVSYKLTGKELYVRALVTSSKPPANPSYKGQLQQAWTQPVGWDKWVSPQPPDVR